MFYDKQLTNAQNEYKNMLKIIGGLSRLFSTAKEPYLYYRAHENIFAKYFDVDNNARSDDSADAFNSEKGIGIGLKTWVGQDNQKVAEFGRLRPNYEHLEGMELINAIARYRNTRIRTTMNVHGLKEMIYHIVKRVPNAMCIYEAAFDEIDISNITLDEKRGNKNSLYFSDGNHTYHFSRSKNTLYMNFDDMILLDQFNVDIFDDPYEVLSQLMSSDKTQLTLPSVSKIAPEKNQLCLRLYQLKNNQKFVAEKSGINQWNAGGRARNPNELYIPYPKVDRERKDFFPSKDISFDLLLPDGQWISAKVCQQDNKAIMSNPNKALGKWLLRDVFELEEVTLITYEMLKEFNIDSVIFTRLDNLKYSVDFCELGTYEKFYNLPDSDREYVVNEDTYGNQ